MPNKQFIMNFQKTFNQIPSLLTGNQSSGTSYYKLLLGSLGGYLKFTICLITTTVTRMS